MVLRSRLDICFLNPQVGTNHRLLKSAKNLLLGSKSNLQSVGLTILLVSKAAGFDPKGFTADHYDCGVLHAQRGLAEIVEMKRTGHLIHKAMENLQNKSEYGDKYEDLLYGNKIVLLTGKLSELTLIVNVINAKVPLEQLL